MGGLLAWKAIVDDGKFCGLALLLGSKLATTTAIEVQTFFSGLL